MPTEESKVEGKQPEPEEQGNIQALFLKMKRIEAMLEQIVEKKEDEKYVPNHIREEKDLIEQALVLADDLKRETENQKSENHLKVLQQRLDEKNKVQIKEMKSVRDANLYKREFADLRIQLTQIFDLKKQTNVPEGPDGKLTEEMKTEISRAFSENQH